MFLSRRSISVSILASVVLFIILPSCNCGLLQYQSKFAALGRTITFQMVQIRERLRNGFADSRTTALRQIGETSIVGRTRTREALDFIESFDGDLSPREAFCLQEALDVQMVYARLFGEDVSQCSDYFHSSFSELHEKAYFAALSTANRLASETFGGTLHVLATESELPSQQHALQQHLNEQEEAWHHSQLELQSLADEKAKAYDDALDVLELCLAQCVLFFNYTIAYVKDELEECLKKAGSE